MLNPFMKSVLKTLVLVAFVGPAFAEKGGDNGPGNGGDKVDGVFYKAQQDVADMLEGITLADVGDLPVKQAFKTWLGEGNHLSDLQLYASGMKIVPQDGACDEDGGKHDASFNGNPQNPIMCVSRELNRGITADQAEILVIHEAVHFAGNTNHFFASSLGVELAKNLGALPELVITNANADTSRVISVDVSQKAHVFVATKAERLLRAEWAREAPGRHVSIIKYVEPRVSERFDEFGKQRWHIQIIMGLSDY